MPRDISGPNSGFCAKLPHHEPGYDARSFETTNQKFYGSPSKESAGKVVEKFRVTSEIAAGQNQFRNHKERATIPLAGEVLKVSEDPGKDTEAQRVWINIRDPGIKAVESNKVPKGIPSYDNQLSLPLGDGHQDPMICKTGAYNKVRRDITLVPLAPK